MDLWASTIQLNLVFGILSDVLALFRFTALVTVELSDLLHGKASAIDVTKFSRVFNDVFVFFVIQIDRTSQSPRIFEFRFLNCPFLFFFLLSSFQSCTTLLAKCNLVEQLFDFLSVSPWTTFILLEVSLSTE